MARWKVFEAQWMAIGNRLDAEFAPQTEHPLVYAEIPGAQHAFEFFHSPRTSHYLNAAASWLEWSYARWRDSQD